MTLRGPRGHWTLAGARAGGRLGEVAAAGKPTRAGGQRRVWSRCPVGVTSESAGLSEARTYSELPADKCKSWAELRAYGAHLLACIDLAQMLRLHADTDGVGAP